MLAKLIKQLRDAWVKPANAKALAVLLNEAIACQGRGEWIAAENLLRRALSQHPRDPNAMHLLANNLMTQRRHAEAKTLLEKVIGTQPENVQAHYHLASTLEALDELEAARQCLMRSLDMQPDSFATMNNLGNVLSKLRRLDEADHWYARALKLAPDFAAVVFNTGQLRRTMGRVPEAIALYQRALELDPSLVGAHSNYIYWLNFLPEYTPQQVFEAHKEWARRHAEPLLAGVAIPANDASPERRLRIGYVSPNFKNHAAAYFFESTLISHDTTAFEIFCYSDVTDPDECTARLKAHGPVWRESANLTDVELADLVRRDRIDILVDLSGHTYDNRLLTFARKPAPLQITWNGYANTTGMSAMDYRITDPLADPPGTTEHLHSEILLRLPDVYMTYHPPAVSPEVNALPALRNGFVTFGSFNAVTKITPQGVQLWSRILQALPQSRLLMAAIPEGSTRERLRGMFVDNAIDPLRIDFHAPVPRPAFLALHHQADLALDPFPFNGTTTTCDSLWMGVPPVALAGQTHAARVGVTLLTNAGLPEMIGHSADDYADIAVRVATDTSRLAEIRAQLRPRLLRSPLMDGPRFTRHLESAYRDIWRKWCAQQSSD